MVRRVEITGLILIYNMAVRLTGPRTDLVTTYVSRDPTPAGFYVIWGLYDEGMASDGMTVDLMKNANYLPFPRTRPKLSFVGFAQTDR
jgi:hypothetical protein